VGFREEWEGDNYYMSLVKQGMAINVATIRTPEEERIKMNENKLILDQPATVTVKGAVEHVVVDQLAVNKQAVPQPKKKDKLVEQPLVDSNEVLLTEDPLEGVTILG
jgi:hypothetical protein